MLIWFRKLIREIFDFLQPERKEKEAEKAERDRLEEMSEDEYDALTEEEKAEVDKKRLDIKKGRIRKLVKLIFKKLHYESYCQCLSIRLEYKIVA